MAEPGIAEVQRTLALMLADLEGFIERKAREVAAPLIEQADAIAEERVREADQRTQRQADLVAELRRQAAFLRRQLDQSRAESRQNAEIAAAALDWQATDG
jgi:hypothetical protein